MAFTDFKSIAQVQSAFQIKYVEQDYIQFEKLFGKSTRGRRLKSDDRITGILPFVTA